LQPFESFKDNLISDPIMNKKTLHAEHAR